MRWVAALVVVAFGCGGESASDVIAKHKAKGTPVLEQVKALQPIIAKQPPVTVRTWSLPPGTKLDFDPGDMVTPNPAFNTGVTYVEYVEKLCDAESRYWNPITPSSGELRLDIERGQDWLLHPACFLTTGKPWDKRSMPINRDVEAQLTWLTQVRYVVVIRLGEVDMANMTSKDTYDPGRVQGDVLVYELGTQKLVGAYPFDATLPDKFMSEWQSKERELDSKLAAYATSAIMAGLTAP